MSLNSSLLQLAVQLKKRARRLYASNFLRSARVAAQRLAQFEGQYKGLSSRVIIVLAPGRDIVNGGVMSLVAIAAESEKLRSVHEADVVVCTCPGEPPLLRYTKFPNDRILFDFAFIMARLAPGTEVLVHVPEMYVAQFFAHSAALLAARAGTLRLRFNILLQNIDMIPQRSDIVPLQEIGPVTVTTAHEAYANVETQRRLGCIVHHLSAWPSPTKFERRPFAERENILVLSPDLHERRDAIVAELKRRLPDFRFVTVWKMTYMEYRELIAKAKFSLTFGEGHDGYFSEMIQGGGIGCAVYNARFFTEDFAALPFIYPSWDELLRRLPDDIRAANVPEEFSRLNDIAYRVLKKGSSAEKFQANLLAYYQKYFPRPPASGRLSLRWDSRHFSPGYVRVMRIQRERRRHLDGLAPRADSRAIILIVPGRNLVNGGVMSIISIAQESEKLRNLHGADVFVCTCPGDPPLLRYTKFANSRTLLDFKAVLDRLAPGKEVLVHIPELYVPQFAAVGLPLIEGRDLRWRFNIMLQNIDMIPSRDVVEKVRERGTVTVTTAHEAYATMDTATQLGCAIHHLSAWPSPTAFERRPFSERENIVVISPDPHERKEEIFGELVARLPEFQFVTVWKMTYTAYRELIAKAKFSLTFGEGHDGYFSEIIQGGGIGSAVYNERFFTDDFASLPFVYPSWDALLQHFPDDVRAANTAEEFARQNGIAYSVLSKESSLERFQENLRSYYEKFFAQATASIAPQLNEVEKS